MKILTVSNNLDPNLLGVVQGNYRIPPRCNKCGGYVIVQDMNGTLLFRCSQCSNMGSVNEIEVTEDIIREVVEKRRARK